MKARQPPRFSFKTMRALIIMNGYPAAEKFYRQSEKIAQELRLRGVETDVKLNGELTACIEADGSVSCVQGYDFAVYLDKDKYLGRMLEKSGVRLFNRAHAVEVCDDKHLT